MDRREFEKQIVSLRGQIFAVAFGIVKNASDADDIAQETLMKLWTLREELTQIKSPSAFARTLAHNKAIDNLRKSQVFSDENELETLTAIEFNAEERLIAAESNQKTDKILAQLPEGMRNVIRMRHVDGLELADIAAITGTNEGAVRTALCRARKRVREIFSQHR